MCRLILLLFILLITSNKVFAQEKRFLIEIKNPILLSDISLKYMINKDSILVYEEHYKDSLVKDLIYSHQYSKEEKDSLSNIIFPFLLKMNEYYCDSTIIDGFSRSIKIYDNETCIKEIRLINVSFAEIRWLLRFSRVKNFIRR